MSSDAEEGEKEQEAATEEEEEPREMTLEEYKQKHSTVSSCCFTRHVECSFLVLQSVCVCVCGGGGGGGGVRETGYASNVEQPLWPPPTCR